MDDNSTPDRDSAGRWQPGSSGNPSGRPAGTREVATLLREALREATTPEKARALADVMLELSLSGNAKVMSLYLRSHGMLTDNVQLSGSEIAWNWQPGGGRQGQQGQQEEEREEDG